MKYFLLQIKRSAKIIPYVLSILLVLLTVALIVFLSLAKFSDNNSKSRFKIGVVGELDNRYFDLGVGALQTLDSSRFAIDIETMDETTAKRELENGILSAYIVVPEGFVEAAEYGEIIPISYYTTVSSVDMASLMKDEITDVVSVYLKESQKGVYGISELLDENGYSRISYKEMNKFNIEYVDFILDRSKSYQLNLNESFGGLNLQEYLFIGLIIVFSCTAIIPFAIFQTRQDNTISKTLSAKGIGACSQVMAEYSAAYIIFAFILGILFAVIGIINKITNFGEIAFNNLEMLPLMFAAVLAETLVLAFAFLIFEMFDSFISSITGFFFISMSLCYIAGCMYPLYALPKILQRIALFTPFGLARQYLSNAAMLEDHALLGLGTAAYTVLLLALTCYIRRHRIVKG